jgi:hypothetical protein
MTEKSIPPELRFLIEAERSRPDAPAEARAIAQAKLAGLLGPIAGLGGGGRDGGSSGPIGRGSAAGSVARGSGRALKGALGVPAAKALAVLALGGLMGGGVATAVIRSGERVVYVERPASAVSATAPLPQVSSATAEIVPPLPSAIASTRGAAPPSAPLSSSMARGRDTDLAAERAIIERARSALARGDAQGALVSIAEHEREFPRGQLVEEREALAVQALVTAGRAQEAAARGAHFRKAFPNSLLLPLVDQALR